MNRPAAPRLPLLLLAAVLAAAALAALAPAPARAFTKDGCGAGECRDCHALTKDEAKKALSQWVDNVTEVRESPVRGLYAVEAEKDGRRGTLYMDYAKRHVLVVGQIVRLDTGEDVSQTRKADLSALPLAKGLTLGKGLPSRRVVILSDPDCHFCQKLHEETKKVLAKDPSVSFTVLLFSRNNDPAAAKRAAAALCGGTEEALDRAYAGTEPGDGSCGMDRVAEIAEAASKLSLRGTPAMIFPDGRVVVGYREGDVILKILSESQGAKDKGAGEGAGGK